MQSLEKSLRTRLEGTVKEAREVAEAAARAALEQLGVGEAVAFSHLSASERELRRKLRVHGRQLGDSLNGGKVQTIDRLIEEMAYEHWHRMLFARFLSENNLLMYPDPGDPIPVTIAECEDLAGDEGAANGWELAARFAARMLPQIFRPESPVFQRVLPPEHQQKLERLLSDLPNEVFTASDSLGWVYQFWQAKKKEEVNVSGVKIGARELPAVTQLFTEPYMVAFLLDNSLGAWWATRRLSTADLGNAQSEDELRTKASLPGVPLEFLRFVRQDNDTWTPAAGTLNTWPEHLSELKTLDPCCGSGHFLVAALLMLVPMRMELEKLSAREAVDRVLAENIHGLEIDQRCVEIAVFAVALTAWRFPDAGGYRQLPELNVACSGLAISAKKEEWVTLAGANTNLRAALEALYDHFKDAPLLGSLINPEMGLAKGSLFELEWSEVAPLLTKALESEENIIRTEMGVVAKGLARAAQLLSAKYGLLILNPPYLVLGKQSDRLREFTSTFYADSRNDLATVFISRCVELVSNFGNVCLVSPQNWLFQPRYKVFRQKLLKQNSVNFIARLGAGAFESISGEIVKVTLSILNSASQYELIVKNIDIPSIESAKSKSESLARSEVTRSKSSDYLRSADSRITSILNITSQCLSSYASTLHGQNAGDNSVFIRCFWEVPSLGDVWETYQNAPTGRETFSGRSQIVLWEQEKGRMARFAESVRHLNHKAQQWRSGKLNWGKKGVAVSLVGRIVGTLYEGDIYGVLCGVLIPNNIENRAALWSFVNSGELEQSVRDLDPNLAIQAKTLLAVPFDLEHWNQIAAKEFPKELPKPYSDDPTQWIFHGNPFHCDEPLQVAAAILLGYRWPAQLDPALNISDDARQLIRKSDALSAYADEDGIVCVPPVRGEAGAADRLVALLAAAYGDAWSNTKLSHLLSYADHAGKTLETWLREKFFTQHCKLFEHRPFIWQIWDGLRDGFSVLVNYHKLDYKNLETLIYTYLGDWIIRQRQDTVQGIDGAQERLAAAEQLKTRLELILEGEVPYDIFVRWKHIEEQSIGWNPDLNDGVRLNIRPFLSVQDIGKKGAGVLRDRPNVKWEKDRGKDVDSAPWYKLFNGDRVNDHHLTLDEKKKARS